MVKYCFDSWSYRLVDRNQAFSCSFELVLLSARSWCWLIISVWLIRRKWREMVRVSGSIGFKKFCLGYDQTAAESISWLEFVNAYPWWCFWFNKFNGLCVGSQEAQVQILRMIFFWLRWFSLSTIKSMIVQLIRWKRDTMGKAKVFTPLCL